MVASDNRRTLIVATTHNFFGVSSEDEFEREELELIDKFLDQKKCRTLCATGYSGRRVRLTNDLSFGENALVFFKVIL